MNLTLLWNGNHVFPVRSRMFVDLSNVVSVCFGDIVDPIDCSVTMFKNIFDYTHPSWRKWLLNVEPVLLPSIQLQSFVAFGLLP